MRTLDQSIDWKPKLLVALLVLTILTGLDAKAAAAEPDLPQPKGEVILTVEGQIRHSNGDGKARFDAGMLRSLGWVEIETETPWTDGVIRFAGVPGTALLDAVGAGDRPVLARALNDYSVEIPARDFRTYGAIIAIEMNGKPLEVRDRGPLWIIYPWTENEETRTDSFSSRSIWMLNSLEVLGE